MRIGIDVSTLCREYDGIGIYVKNVVDYLICNSKDNIFLYADRPIVVNFENCTIIEDDGNDIFHTHLKWLLFTLPKLLKRDKIDVFWQPSFIFPMKINNMKNIITIHDMSAYAYKNYAPIKTIIEQRLFLKKSCKYANLIIAISDSCKKEIVQNLNINSQKIVVIYDGKKLLSQLENISGKTETDFLEKHGLNRKEYFLFVGTMHPRKNIDVIIDAFNNYRNDGGGKKLVLAGKFAPNSNSLQEKLCESEYKESIILTGYISETEKNILYKNAFSLLYPSRLEGFGFPILEAFQAKLPVITSNVSSMPEVAGDAAFYLNNIDDYKELSNLMFTVEHSDKVILDEYISRGEIRLDYFNNYDYEKKTYEKIRNCYENRDCCS